ncbi:hypothetical protein V1511DRAFT_495111 [Dipodascopsis uninucleata]
MIPDYSLQRFAPPSFARALHPMSSGGALAIITTKPTAGSVALMPGLAFFDPVIGIDSSGTKTDNQVESRTIKVITEKEILWFDSKLMGTSRNRFRNAVNNEEAYALESLADGQVDMMVADAVFSPSQTSTPNMFVIISTTLEVFIFEDLSTGHCQWRLKWNLSDFILSHYQETSSNPLFAHSIASNNISQNEDDTAGEWIDMEDSIALKKLRLHCVDWSKSFGHGLSLIATGNELGELSIWSTTRFAKDLKLACIVTVSDTWIVSVKFSDRILLSNIADNLLFIMYVAAVTRQNAIIMCRCSVERKSSSLSSDILDVTVLSQQEVSPPGISRYSNLDWSSLSMFDDSAGPQILQLVAANVRYALMVTIDVKSSEISSSKHVNKIVMPVIGIIFERPTNAFAHRISNAVLVSCDGKVAPLFHDKKSALAEKISSLLEKRIEMFKLSLPAKDRPSNLEMRIYGIASSRTALLTTIMYTVVPGNVLRYPLTSKEWSRLAFIAANESISFSDIAECYSKSPEEFGPESMLWEVRTFALCSSSQSNYYRQAEQSWIEDALQTIKLKTSNTQQSRNGDSLDTRIIYMMYQSRSSLWRRMATGVYSWASSFYHNDEEKIKEISSAALVNERRTRTALACSIMLATIVKAKSDTSHSHEAGGDDLLSRQMIYGFAKYLHDMADKDDITTYVSKDSGIFNSFEYMISTTMSENENTGDKLMKCVACDSELTYIFNKETGECIGRCLKSHSWTLCSLTMIPLMGLHMRQCRFCGKWATGSATNDDQDQLQEDKITLFEQVIKECTVCVFCGDRFIVK